MSTNISAKIWSFCDTLRDDGLGYGDYLEQLTYLLFLKMADENKELSVIPKGCDWATLKASKSESIRATYEQALDKLGGSGGMLAKIFSDARNRIYDSVKLKRLIELIDEQDWTSTEIDVKGEIYESLLQRNAENSGAGQYFTPRPVIQAMVECIDPKLGESISDPSCGTGGFFLGALDYLKRGKLTEKQNHKLKFETFKGWEIETSTARLCLMNLYLHGIGDLKQTPEIIVSDSLKQTPEKLVDIILANPPFGISSSDVPTPDEKLAKKDGYFLRSDFWVTTSNKQLAFLQHIYTMLNKNGRAAVVLPDNVLFDTVGTEIRKELLQRTNLHTILRLPSGIFYAQGVKANVLFFEVVTDSKKPATKEIWYYDYRTNIKHSPKRNPLRFENLKSFVELYKSHKRKETWAETTEGSASPEGRWRKYLYKDIISNEKVNLDITWLRDNNMINLENLPEPEELANDIIENLRAGLESFESVIKELKER